MIKYHYAITYKPDWPVSDFLKLYNWCVFRIIRAVISTVFSTSPSRWDIRGDLEVLRFLRRKGGPQGESLVGYSLLADLQAYESAFQADHGPIQVNVRILWRR